MNPNKTTILRFKPISEITEEEMKEEVLACDCRHFLRGKIKNDKDYGFLCSDEFGRFLPNVATYAVLPKDE